MWKQLAGIPSHWSFFFQCPLSIKIEAFCSKRFAFMSVCHGKTARVILSLIHCITKYKKQKAERPRHLPLSLLENSKDWEDLERWEKLDVQYDGGKTENRKWGWRGYIRRVFLSLTLVTMLCLAMDRAGFIWEQKAAWSPPQKIPLTEGARKILESVSVQQPDIHPFSVPVSCWFGSRGSGSVFVKG